MAVKQNSFAQRRPDQLVYLELGAGNGGMLLSISEDGFRFHSVTPMRSDGMVPFAFSLDGVHRLQGVGEIEWLEDDAKSGGMRFADVSPEFRAALSQWLASESPKAGSGREVTPAVAIPLDTMEKIREELRRDHPERPRSAAAPQSSAESPPHRDAPATAPFSGPRRSAPPAHPPSAPASEQTPESPSVQPSAPHPPPSLIAPRRPPLPEHPRASLRPHFTQPEEPPSENSAVPASAFLKIPRPLPSESSPSPAEPKPPVVAEPDSPDAVARSLRESFAAAGASSKKRRSAEPAPPPRPYIPPPEESFEAAWERAKLSIPPESPHLSRAAAGTIIGLALAVILATLAFNFRQDIGAFVIELGQGISGENRPASLKAGPESAAPPQTAPVSQPAGTEPAAAVKPDSGTASRGPANETAVTGKSSPAGREERTSNETRSANPEQTVANPANGSSRTEAGNASGVLPATVAAGSSLAKPQSDRSAQDSTTAGIGRVAEPVESSSGQEEFNLARAMLLGSHRQRDLPVAVNLLWSGVRKGYVPAEVTLADLYRRGEGVEKNCDQAQVLLVAASKKGSPDARRMLEQMAEEGCE